jgi:copper ion binding protein
MKRIHFALINLLLIGLLALPAVAGDKEKKEKGEYTILIKGMMCSDCVSRVQKALLEVDGVQSAEVSLEKSEARVVVKGKNVTAKTLRKAVRSAGFEPIRIEKEEAATALVKIKGMMCADCEAKVKKALLQLEGVEEAEVSAKTGEARILLNPEKVNEKGLRNAVKAAGFEPVAIRFPEKEKK